MTIQSLTENYGSETFRGLDMTKLQMDHAYLLISNLGSKITYLFSTYKDCINCPYFDEFGMLPGNMTSKISTAHQKLYKVLTKPLVNLPFDSNDSVMCDLDTNFGEFGVYHLEVRESGCALETLKEPVNIYLPIATVFIIYFCLFTFIAMSVYAIRFFRKKHNKDDTKVQSNDSMVTKKERVKSLDTFRGITIALMIFVNYGGGGYDFIEHAIWNGLHVADLVFPWFLWIMGVCIPMSIRSAIKSGVSMKKALLNIARRSVILFMIGIFLGGSSNLKYLRIFGVLQRFGICYLVVASICLIISKMYEKDENERSSVFQGIFRDVLKIKRPWVIMILILAVHTAIVFLVPVKDCPSGYMGPGGSHENGKYINCTGGITGHIDRTILGNHVYRYPTIGTIYNSQAFDPEGILGCLTSIVQVFVGVQAGTTLMTFKDHKARVIRWIVWAAILGITGGGLAGFSREGGVIPINKNLWSLSFMLVTSSLAFALLCICYVLVDIKKWWSGKPFLYAGMNAIIMYIGHSMVHSNFPFRWYIEGNDTHFLNLLENIWATLMWIFVAYILYKKKYFLTI